MGYATCRGSVVQQNLMCFSGLGQPPFLDDPKMGRGGNQKLMTGEAWLLIRSRDAHPPYTAG